MIIDEVFFPFEWCKECEDLVQLRVYEVNSMEHCFLVCGDNISKSKMCNLWRINTFTQLKI